MGKLYSGKKIVGFRSALIGGCYHGINRGRLTRSRVSYMINLGEHIWLFSNWPEAEVKIREVGSQ